MLAIGYHLLLMCGLFFRLGSNSTQKTQSPAQTPLASGSFDSGSCEGDFVGKKVKKDSNATAFQALRTALMNLSKRLSGFLGFSPKHAASAPNGPEPQSSSESFKLGDRQASSEKALSTQDMRQQAAAILLKPDILVQAPEAGRLVGTWDAKAEYGEHIQKALEESLKQDLNKDQLFKDMARCDYTFRAAGPGGEPTVLKTLPKGNAGFELEGVPKSPPSEGAEKGQDKGIALLDTLLTEQVYPKLAHASGTEAGPDSTALGQALKLMHQGLFADVATVVKDAKGPDILASENCEDRSVSFDLEKTQDATYRLTATARFEGLPYVIMVHTPEDEAQALPLECSGHTFVEQTICVEIGLDPQVQVKLVEAKKVLFLEKIEAM
jgi:hypothetical protein